MSSERPGSKYSVALMKSSSLEDWQLALDNYDAAIRIVSAVKMDDELPALDEWWRNEYSAVVRSREPFFINSDELMRIVKWKLGRGKNRPMLLGLIKENSEKEIFDISSVAFQSLDDNDWKIAFTTLMKLRGVGPATASAILAPLSPDKYPFMADEVLESVTTRSYSLKAYEKMRDALVKKSNQVSGTEWNPEKIGKALWAHAIVSLPTKSDSMTRKRGIAEDKQKDPTKIRRRR